MLEDSEQVLVLEQLFFCGSLVLASLNRGGLDPVLESCLQFLALELCLNDINKILGSLLEQDIVISLPSLLNVPVRS